jgi:hypothetical protein
MYINASGHLLPPMVIYPTKNMIMHLMRWTPLDAIGVAHPCGWVQGNWFTQWFHYYLEHVKPSAGSPVLSIFDEHYSLASNVDIIDLASPPYRPQAAAVR